MTFQTLTSKTVALVLLMAFLQIPVSQCNASLSDCTPECSIGFECVHGECKRQTCTRDCSSAEETVCGSNGITYSNQCELEEARCELMQNISLVHKGACSCSAFQNKFDTITLEEFSAKCFKPGNADKSSSGTLGLRDVTNCFRPQCNRDNAHQYVFKQCSFIFTEYCWCSSHDGHIAADTFQRNMPEGYCSNYYNQQNCEVDGQKYKDGDIFPSSSICGLCECVGGTQSCFINFTVNDSSGHLSTEQLDILKSQIIFVFDFQLNNSNNVAASKVQKALKTPLSVPSSRKETVLRKKFNEYDKNKDGSLNFVEEFFLRKQLSKIFGCPTIFSNLRELFDEDNDNAIPLHEWFAFFGLSLQETSGSAEQATDQTTQMKSKREALTDQRKPLHQRRKFRYTFS